MKLAKDLSEFIELLNSAGVEYLIVGAHALGFHGRPRFTGDIDIWVRPDPVNAVRIVTTLAQFGFSSIGLTIEDFVLPNQVVQLGQPPNRIDLLTSISGADFVSAWKTRVAGTLGDLPVYFLGKSELIVNKRATGRLKDLADAESLETE